MSQDDKEKTEPWYRFSRTALPYPEPRFWTKFQKKTLTPAIRILGPFEVETSEGVLRCEDGWLALDADGNPYPIDNSVFLRTYVPLRR